MVIALLSGLLIAVGTVFLLAAAVGVLRFPDFYTRLHAAGKGDTLGQVLVLAGLALTAGLGLVSVKLGLIALFLFVFNPTATHALARGAWICGVRPWTGRGAGPDGVQEGALGRAEREALLAEGRSGLPDEASERSPAGPRPPATGGRDG